MKVYSQEQPDAYAVSGNELRVHWNITEVSKQDMDGNAETVWEANESLCNRFDDRATLIENIIGSVHTTGAEIAIINNQVSQPEAYADYQAFRLQAKTLADGWLATK